VSAQKNTKIGEVIKYVDSLYTLSQYIMSEADFEVTFYAECYKEKRRALQICLTSLHMAKKLGNHDCAFNGVARIFVFFLH